MKCESAHGKRKVEHWGWSIAAWVALILMFVLAYCATSKLQP